MSVIGMYRASDWWSRIKRYTLEFSIAWLLFTCVVVTYGWYQHRQREDAPASEYLEVRQIGVPDHPINTDPIITYDRSVNKPFRGIYTVEVQHNGTLQPIEDCSTTRTINYEPDKKLPEGGPTLSWFIGHKCEIPAGAYRLEACWDIFRIRASMVHYCRMSAVFNVIDAKALLETAK